LLIGITDVSELCIFTAIKKSSFYLGVREAFHPNAVLELSTVGIGEVKILGLESNLFLAMNAEGQLYGEEVSNSPIS
jgi:hypothetical protein